MKRISLALILAFVITACSFLTLAQPKPTATVPPPPPPTEAPQIVVPTEAPAPTLAPMPTDTVEPSATVEVATATGTPPVDTATPEVESWRITPMPGANFIANEKVSDPQYDSIMADQARNLSITQPYYWDIYSVTAATRYKAVKDYYAPIILQSGYVVNQDIQGNDEIYLLTFIKKDTKSKIVIQFNASTAKRKTGAILIFYSNP